MINLFYSIGVDEDLADKILDNIDPKQLINYRNEKYLVVFGSAFVEYWLRIQNDQFPKGFNIKIRGGKPIIINDIKNTEGDTYKFKFNNYELTATSCLKPLYKGFTRNKELLARLGGICQEVKIVKKREYKITPYDNPFIKIRGRIKEIELTENELNGFPYYEIVLDANEFEILVCIAKDFFKKEPEVDDFIEGVYLLTIELARKYKGKNLKIKNHPTIKNIDDLYKNILNSLSVYTTNERIKPYYDEKDLFFGQDEIICLVVQNYLGGEIYKTKQGPYDIYFNMINNEVVDLTLGQHDLFYIEYDYNNSEKVEIREENKDRLYLLEHNINKSSLKEGYN